MVHYFKNHNQKISFLLTVAIVSAIIFALYAYAQTDCIVCPQFVPDCKPNEKLVNQTCEKCAHCELVTDSSSSLGCAIPCGSKCCKEGQQCVTFDICKGRKLSCKLPVYQFCTSLSLTPASK